MLRPDEVLPLWTALAGAARRLGRLQVWCPSRRSASRSGHPTATLVVGLAGVTRVSRAGERVDLLAGDALVIGRWIAHEHAPLRRGAACLCQGFDRGGSDIELMAEHRRWSRLFSAVPYRELLESALASAGDEEARRCAVMDAIQHLLHEDWTPGATMPQPLLRGVNALRSRAAERIDARTLVAATGLSQATAYRHFRRWVGATPRRALEQRRLSLAAELLAAGVSCAEAAHRCGFANRFTFSRAFRRVNGATPRAWRRRHRER